MLRSMLMKVGFFYVLISDFSTFEDGFGLNDFLLLNRRASVN